MSFNKISINIGKRQIDRIQSELTINCGYLSKNIQSAIKKGLTKKRKKIKKNPYGDGKTSKKILHILNKFNLSNNFLIKKITF